MAKNLKLNIKNEQLADALNISDLKAKLNKKKIGDKEKDKEGTDKKKSTSKEKTTKKSTTSAPKETKEKATTKKVSTKAKKEEAAEATTAKAKTSSSKKEKAKTTPKRPSVKAKKEESSAVPSKEKAPTVVEKPAQPQKIPTSEKEPAKAVEASKTKEESSTKPVKEKFKKGASKSLVDKYEKSYISESPPNKPLLNKPPKSKVYYDMDSLYKEGYKFKGAFGKDGATSEWRKKRKHAKIKPREEEIIRPSELTLKLPISVKNLSEAMKVKASDIVAKLFKEGYTFTLNDVLDDETLVEIIGEEFNCKIAIDTSKEDRIRITDKTLQEEIAESNPKDLQPRAPIITFMGHVDHGKTSLIDAIRKSNRVSSEAGAITQHIGAFSCETSHGKITILDTPGHEAFSEMRERGANVTDIVVLVVAGDEGIRDQTIEALKHAKAAGVTIVVAINKCDKEGFNPEQIYRQLSEHDLVAEDWGGSTITVKCSAKTGEGVKDLMEMLALQAEVMELKANPSMRARGTVLEAETHKGLGSVSTILVQNGTLKIGDSLVLGHQYAKVKTMHDATGQELESAPPSTPVEITGLSGLPESGEDFIVVESEKEARDIATAREAEYRHTFLLSRKRSSLDKFMDSEDTPKKELHLILRADTKGSLEALKSSIFGIRSKKIEPIVVFAGIGEITESDVRLASASKACIVGFHTKVESHAEGTIKKHPEVKLIKDEIIYHVIDQIKEVMVDRLDRIEQENDKGELKIKAVFNASKIGKIAGCLVTKGVITRNDFVRVVRNGEVVWKGKIASLKRERDDVKEVKKGLECGVLLQGFNNVEVDDELQVYDITYLKQKL